MGGWGGGVGRRPQYMWGVGGEGWSGRSIRMRVWLRLPHHGFHWAGEGGFGSDPSPPPMGCQP